MNHRQGYFGTPLFEDAVKVMFLGGGELGKELVLEAQRLGVETIVVDRYSNPPAAQLSHRSYTVDMRSRGAVKALAYRERPDVIVPEIEAVNTDVLLELEEEGFDIIPSAGATKVTMDRILLRRLAAEEAGVKTSPYSEAHNLDELKEACEEIGYPCLVKARMSSGGLGSTLVKNRDQISLAYENSRRFARGRGDEMIVEALISFDLEVTELVLAHTDGSLSFCKPVGHLRSGSHYHTSWQPFIQPDHQFYGYGSDLHRIEDPPRNGLLWSSRWNGKTISQDMIKEVEDQIYEVAGRVVEKLPDQKNGKKKGIFGCELFIKFGEEETDEKPVVYFNEASPRPHDTGMVTTVTQDQSEMALHIRAVLELPVPRINLLTSAAAHVILAEKEGWAVRYSGLDKALLAEDCYVRIFGKPLALPERRMGLVIASHKDVNEARLNACRVAHELEKGIVYG